MQKEDRRKKGSKCPGDKSFNLAHPQAPPQKKFLSEGNIPNHKGEVPLSV